MCSAVTSYLTPISSFGALFIKGYGKSDIKFVPANVQMRASWRVLVVVMVVVCVVLGEKCGAIKDCSECADNSACVWEVKAEYCLSIRQVDDYYTSVNSSTELNCESEVCVVIPRRNGSEVDSFCRGDSCVCGNHCESAYFPCSPTIIGQILLMGLYGVVLAFGAFCISEGSELLLEVVNSPGLIGGLVIPVLGAVPDAAVVIFSGLGGTAAEAQEKLAVGVGTLAGSTIMLLTIPWSVGLLLARTNIVHGESVDKHLTVPFWDLRGLYTTGTSVDRETRINALVMIVTTISYVMIQVLALIFINNPLGKPAHKYEKWISLASAVLCLVLFAAYSVYQVVVPSLQKKKLANIQTKLRIQKGVQIFTAQQERALALASQRTAAQLKRGKGEKQPLLGVQAEDAPIEIPDAQLRLILLRWRRNAKRSAIDNDRYEEEGEESEEEGENGIVLGCVPSSFLSRAYVLAISIAWLLAGTALVSFFSDPMVDVITEFGESIHIGAFFVSFIVTPFCSNASELISSLIFAAKKRKENSALTYSSLYGAATMNNTMVLGIFFVLIFVRGLAWTFTAETFAILFVTITVGLVGILKRTFSIYWSFIIIFLYPLSILLVWVLEDVAGLK